MARLSQEEINRIRSSVNIVDIISSYIPLTQKGANYWCVCPFHDDHSPSMSVSKEKQMYKCFSCGAAGNVFNFVEHYENISYIESVKMIALKAGITISGSFSYQPVKKYEKELEIMRLSSLFFENNLQTESGTAARGYLEKRGLSKEHIKEFAIGLSMDQNSLYKFLKQRGYDDTILENLGLISVTENFIKDTFVNRVIFPIHNLLGDVVGFTARVYKDDRKPKYVNTKETVLFKKGNILYNYHRARDTIKREKRVIIVEGNMDALRMSVSGFKNTIALMGTSLTENQIQAIQKLRVPVILMLDNDEAGETATYHDGILLEQNKIEVSVVRLSGEKDPDSYILKNGVEAMSSNLKNAVPFLDFKFSYLKKGKNLERNEDLRDYIKTILESIKNNPDALLKEITIRNLSETYHLSYDLLKQEIDLQNIEKERQNFSSSVSNLKDTKTPKEKILDSILYYMCLDKKYVQLFQSQIGYFREKKYRDMMNEIVYYCEFYGIINLADFMTYLETSDLKTEFFRIFSEVNEENPREETMKEYIEVLKKHIVKEEINALKKEIKQEMDVEKKVELAKKLTELKKGSVGIC